jgi:MinD-like ATPase involved in chromosome partitioning or flagellar assembly
VTDGILPVDVAVVGEDPLWVATTMNAVAEQVPDAYLREYATVLQALDHLVPGHPAVVVCSPDALDDALGASAAAATGRPELAFLFTVDATGDARVAGVTAWDADDPAVAVETERLLLEQRSADRAPGPTGTRTGGPAHAPREDMRIVAVTAGKGGTGATTVTLNLAAALAAATGARVTLVDAHGVTGDVGLLLGLPRAEPGSIDRLEIDEDSIGHYTVVHETTGVRVVSLPRDEDRLQSLGGPDLLAVLAALGPHTDLTVIDAPLELLVSSELAMYANALLLVSTTGLPSLKNTRIAADAIGRSDRMGLVINETTTGAAAPGRGAIERSVQVALLAELPFDEHVAAGAASDPATALSIPSSRFSKQVRDLAEHLVEQALATPATG